MPAKDNIWIKRPAPNGAVRADLVSSIWFSPENPLADKPVRCGIAIGGTSAAVGFCLPGQRDAAMAGFLEALREAQNLEADFAVIEPVLPRGDAQRMQDDLPITWRVHANQWPATPSQT
jgi:hypothetical protein